MAALSLVVLIAGPGLPLGLPDDVSYELPSFLRVISDAQAQPLLSPMTGRRDVFLLEKIQVRPDNCEMENLVAKALGLRPGEYVGLSVLTESKARLEASGVFKDVQVHTERGTEPGSIILVVEATVGPRFQVESGIGHEDLSGWYLNLIGFRWTSPFRQGGTLRLGLHEGLETSGFILNMELPSVIGDQYSALFDLALTNRTWFFHDDFQQYSQEVRGARARFGIGRSFGASTNGAFWVGYVDAEPDEDVDGEDEETYPAENFLPRPETDRYLDLRTEWLFEQKDPLRDWQRRRWAGLRLRLAEGFDTASFWSAEADARLSVPTPGGGAGAFRLRGAWTGPGTPYHQRFALGGIRNLRGYSRARLSGPLGAQAYWLGSAEYRHPLLGKDDPRPRVLGTLFVDVGDHWDPDRNRGGVAAGGGYGLQIHIPWVQVLTAEVSYPITNDRTSQPVALYVSLGRSF